MLMKRTCIQCGKEFEITQSEINFYKSKNLQLPKRCKECRAENKGKKNSQSAADNSSASKPQQTSKKTQTSAAKKPFGSKGIIGIIAFIVVAVIAVFGFFGKGNTDSGLSQPETDAYFEEFIPETGSQPESETAAETANDNPYADAPTVNADNNPLDENVSFYIGEDEETTKKQNTQHNDDLTAPVYTEKETQSSASSGSQVSTKNYYFRNQKLLDQHYNKHGKEMGFKSAAAYEAAASKVINNPNALHKTEKEDGDYVYYVKSSNEFVILSTDGYIRTYFNPSGGLDYYNRQ